MHLLISIFVSVAILALSPTLVRANYTTFLEEFNGNELINWQVIENTGSGKWPYCLDVLSPAKWRIDQGWAKLIVDGIACTLAISPINNNIFVGENWQIDFDWRLDESIDMDRNFVWWWQDSNNWYDLKLYGTGIHLQKVVNGEVFLLEKNHTTFPFQSNQVYHWTIKYQSKQISILINNQLILSTLDTEPLLANRQTLALKTSLGSKRSVSSFDNIRVISLSNQSSLELAVPLIKQTDPRWSTLEYDKAKTWSENWTIERWGCALASAVMILNYHQFMELPNGQAINPPNLNNWLLNQPDGYIGDGLLNWQALSRLTALMSATNYLPKLEYQRIDLTSIESAIEPLSKNLPLILNIPGHFLITNGYVLNPLDLFILDPAFSYRYLSEHQQKPTSARLFTPSHTDLSYLLIVTKPDIEVTLHAKNDLNSIPPEIDQYIESIQDELSSKSTASKITSIKKPETTNFELKINNPTGAESNLSIFSYNQIGQVDIIHKTVEKNSQTTWSINLQPKTNPPNIAVEPASSSVNQGWETLLQQFIKFQQSDLNLTWHFYQHLINLIKKAPLSAITDQLSYQNLIKSNLTNYPILTENKTNLLNTLNSLNLDI